MTLITILHKTSTIFLCAGLLLINPTQILGSQIFNYMPDLNTRQPNQLQLEALPQMQQLVQTEQADLKTYPVNILQFTPNTVVTLGDMHGNALKFMWELIHNGIISATNEDYQLACDLYSNPDLVQTKDALDQYRQLLTRVTVRSPSPSIRLLGDLIADRGNNDIMTLLLLEKISQHKVSVEIVNSNHDTFILSCYDANPDSWSNILNPYEDSVEKLQLLIANQVVEHKEFVRLIKEVYLPQFVLLSYTLEDNEENITLFMHAPNNLKPIEDLAKELDVPYTGDTAKDLARTIDAINGKFNLLWSKDGKDKPQFKQLLRKANDSQRSTKIYLHIMSEAPTTDNIQNVLNMGYNIQYITHEKNIYAVKNGIPELLTPTKNSVNQNWLHDDIIQNFKVETTVVLGPNAQKSITANTDHIPEGTSLGDELYATGKCSPIHALIWNYGSRSYSSCNARQAMEEELDTLPLYVKKVVHGHTGPYTIPIPGYINKIPHPKEVNLDTILGKINLEIDTYISYVTIEPDFKQSQLRVLPFHAAK